MTKILMPKATAVWLIDNTSCRLNKLVCFAACTRLRFSPSLTEKLALAFKDMIQFEWADYPRELDRCEADETAVLALTTSHLPTRIGERKGRGMCQWHAAVTNLTRLCGW